jgi:diketogulonate reductase-like aldo/keto reductase
VLYNLEHRGIEWDLLPWCREHDLVVMAYSPLGSDGQSLRRLLGHPALRAVAERHSATPAQIALAWVLRQPGVVVIPTAGSADLPPTVKRTAPSFAAIFARKKAGLGP